MTIHIRDIMASRMDSLDNIQQVTMCGIQHSEGQKLVFGIPSASTCEKCIRIWNKERESAKDEDAVRHKFRLGMHSVINNNPETKVSRHWKKAGRK